MEELRALGPTVSINQARALLNMGRKQAYERANAGTFPCKCFRVGRIFKVVAADLERILSAEEG